MPDLSADEVLKTSLLAGELILRYGGETYRAEETVNKICDAAGYSDRDVIALPTGVFLTLHGEQSPFSSARRISQRTTDLARLERINALCRRFTAGELALSALRKQLMAVQAEKAPNFWLSSVYAGGATAFFTLLFGGSLFDTVWAFICGFLVQTIVSALGKTTVHSFGSTFLGGLIMALVAVGAVSLFHQGSLSLIIVGAITPLLPGLAMTNAIRDTITGDLVSGIARLTDALLSAVSLAGGVGVVLSFYLTAGGQL